MTTKPLEFDTKKYLAENLMTLVNYVNRPGFVQTVGWDREDMSDVLVERQTKRLAVLVLVGKISTSKMWCGPIGNFASEVTYGDIDKAKFQFTVTCPEDPILAQEYEKAIKVLRLLQRDVAKTERQQHLLVNDGSDIRLNQALFEKREQVSSLFHRLWEYPLSFCSH